VIARARTLAALVLAAAAVLALSGCVGISFTGTKQSTSMGPVTLTVSACANGAPGCSASANTGSIYNFLLDGEDHDGQMLFAVRLPDGATPPDALNASLGGGGTLGFGRSASFETQLQTLEPAPAGERWWGYLSAAFTYSKASSQSFTVSFPVSIPRAADGGPYPSPLKWRPAVGTRYADNGSYPSARPVYCGPETSDLYNGFHEQGQAGSTVICIDSPDASSTRGFLGAPIVDFGLTGTAVTASAGSTVTATFLARRSGSPDPSTTFDLAASSGVPGGSVTIDRTTASLGGDSTTPVLATVTVPAGTAPGSYPVTLTATAAGKPTRSATSTVTVPATAVAPGTGTIDLTASLKPKRFRAGTVKGKAAKGLPPVGAKLKLDVSRASSLSIAIEKKLGRKGFRKLRTINRSLPSARSAIAIKSKLGSYKLTPGKHRLRLSASADGLRSPTRTVTFTFVAG
jgi:hypothetical protein